MIWMHVASKSSMTLSCYNLINKYSKTYIWPIWRGALVLLCNRAKLVYHRPYLMMPHESVMDIDESILVVGSPVDWVVFDVWNTCVLILSGHYRKSNILVCTVFLVHFCHTKVVSWFVCAVWKTILWHWEIQQVRLLWGFANPIFWR